MVFFSVPGMLIYLLIRLESAGPGLYKQLRIGEGGRPFILYKFRTMQEQHANNSVLISDSCRITRFGNVLRKYSLDELPEAWNVLKGEMSLVGPRPLLVRYLARYTPEQARRHSVKPGISGLAQINGRNAITWEEKFYYDLLYIDTWNLALDLKIILSTIIKVISHEGLNQSRLNTMQEFLGKGKDAPSS